MVTIEIETDNAAFEDGPAEVARILRKLADRFDGPIQRSRWALPHRARGLPALRETVHLYDVNGNPVGTARQK